MQARGKYKFWLIQKIPSWIEAPFAIDSGGGSTYTENNKNNDQGAYYADSQ